VGEIPLLGRGGVIRGRALVDDEDLNRVLEFGPWHISQGYVTKTVGLHRFVMLGTNLNDPMMVDHKDRDPFNNRKSNLRVVTNAQSVQNRGIWGVSKYRGVSFRKDCGKWCAQGKLNGVRHFLGKFDTEEEAAEVAEVWRMENLPFYISERQA
jgi:hypothetical protein